MNICRELENLPNENLTVAVGTFDGVHLGHGAIIRKCKELAQPRRDVALTFDPHPKEIVSVEDAPELLSLPEEKVELIEDLGVTNLLVVPFDEEISELSAREFLSEFIGERLSTLVVGFNFKLGQGGVTGVGELEMLAKEIGFSLRVEGPVVVDGRPVSSTRIRSELKKGKVGSAAGMLGRPYKLTGIVRSGDSIGRTLGFPTANLEVSPRKLIPLDGVYACRGVLGSESYRALSSIGSRPTFESKDRAVEVYALGFEGTIYGEEVSIEFLERIRDVRPFDSPEALKKRIEMDLEEAQGIFDAMGFNG
jgi:riboflavin kinase/FMN adenylyltransferase